MPYRDDYEEERARDALQRLGREASPGPWKAENFQVVPAREFRSKMVPTKVIANCASYADAAYVAAANPTTIARLLAENARLRARIHKLATDESLSLADVRQALREELSA